MFIQQANQQYHDAADINRLCLPLRIEWGEWNLSAIEESLAAIKQKNGYVTEDTVSLSSETPNLEAILAKFDKPHHHTDDEVRLVLSGSGVFGIIPSNGDAFEIHVIKGDFIVVPAYTRHWFTLNEDRHITALRIFKTQAGWEAIYDELQVA